MHVIDYRKIPGRKIDTPDVQGVTMHIAAGAEHGAPNFTMRVFVIAAGGHSPFHAHPYEHEIFFHSGEAEVIYEGKTVLVSSGYVAYIPPGAKHQIRNVGDKDLIFICVVPKGI